jgi:hypothetical protein
MVLIDLLHNLLHALLKLGCGPFCGVKNFFIVELNYYIEEISCYKQKKKNKTSETNTKKT